MAKPNPIWILSDGIAGHVNTVRGVAAELARLTGREVREYTLTPRFGRATRWASTALKSGGKAPAALWALNPDPAADEQPALILSAGGRTGLANAAFARHYNAPNAYFSSLRGLPANAFSACFTILPEQVTASNIHLLPISASHVTAEAISRYGTALRQQLDCPAEAPVWCVLLGGDAPGYSYSKQDWRDFADGLAKAVTDSGARLLITGSRRTPDFAARLLADTLPADTLLRSQWTPSKDPLDRIEAYLGAADQIVVTDDSTSMISDALLTRKPVTSIHPAIGTDALARDQQIRANFVAQGHLRRLPIGQTSRLAEAWPTPFTPLPDRAEWQSLDHLLPLLPEDQP